MNPSLQPQRQTFKRKLEFPKKFEIFEENQLDIVESKYQQNI